MNFYDDVDTNDRITGILRTSQSQNYRLLNYNFKRGVYLYISNRRYGTPHWTTQIFSTQKWRLIVEKNTKNNGADGAL